jgi:hypothetical protein
LFKDPLAILLFIITIFGDSQNVKTNSLQRRSDEKRALCFHPKLSFSLRVLRPECHDGVAIEEVQHERGGGEPNVLSAGFDAPGVDPLDSFKIYDLPISLSCLQEQGEEDILTDKWDIDMLSKLIQ